MIFLRDNVLLERDLSPDGIKHIIGMSAGTSIMTA
jgi:hypothetical protein